MSCLIQGHTRERKKLIHSGEGEMTITICNEYCWLGTTHYQQCVVVYYYTGELNVNCIITDRRLLKENERERKQKQERERERERGI